jgi:hypothetical protein
MDDMITAALPTQALIEEEKSSEQKTTEREQLNEDRHLAALKDHPGWAQIREQMLKDIDDFRNLTNVDISKYTDAELGQVVRGEKMVADKLQGYVQKIESAVKAVVASNG